MKLDNNNAKHPDQSTTISDADKSFIKEYVQNFRTNFLPSLQQGSELDTVAIACSDGVIMKLAYSDTQKDCIIDEVSEDLQDVITEYHFENIKSLVTEKRKALPLLVCLNDDIFILKSYAKSQWSAKAAKTDSKKLIEAYTL